MSNSDFTYSIESIQLSRVNKIKDLGVIFDQNLSFVPCISNSAQIAINAFLHTGISPNNANVFPDHHFAPSETTNCVIMGSLNQM